LLLHDPKNKVYKKATEIPKIRILFSEVKFMATTLAQFAKTASTLQRPIVTKIAGKFQLTVPPEIREIYQLREGDLIEWVFNAASAQLLLVPKRAQLITPQIESEVAEVRSRRAKEKLAATTR
jgi:bifunctional DNA-binding transcriptional regulator/antitoxin component of YhaV-PrlF toxin-antitoxin module